MPYEYGYELATCDNCGSSLFLTGEGCANCKGEAQQPDANASLRQASITQKFNATRDAEATRRLDQENRNAEFSEELNAAVSNSLKRQEARAELEAEIAKAFQRTISTFPPKVMNAIDKDFVVLVAQSPKTFTKAQAKALLSILRIIRAADLMPYTDARGQYIRDKRRRALHAYETLMGHPFDSRHTRRLTPEQTRKIPMQFPVEEVEKITSSHPPSAALVHANSPLTLSAIGPSDQVRHAFECAQKLDLTPRYLVFSRRPDVLWKAQVKLARPWEDLMNILMAAGWKTP